MRTIGVDLAAEAAGTALAALHWAAGSARLTDLRIGVGDHAILDAWRPGTTVGIDCPFGWPDDFVAFVADHAAADRPGDPVDGTKAWRSRLAYRETDRIVRERSGRWPLSVATDRLGLTAMRCAGLLDRLRRAGLDVDRAGGGDVVEVYPGAALRLWGFEIRGYKGDVRRRAELLDDLLNDAPWLDLSGYSGLLVQSADAFDALIAALVARAAATGRTALPQAGEQLDRARREGWIALPDDSVTALLATASSPR